MSDADELNIERLDWLHSFYRHISILSSRTGVIADFLNSLLEIIQPFCKCEKVEAIITDSLNWSSASVGPQGEGYTFKSQPRDYLEGYNKIFKDLSRINALDGSTEDPLFTTFVSKGVVFHVLKKVEGGVKKRLELEIESYHDVLSDKGVFRYVAIMPMNIGGEYLGQVLFKRNDSDCYFLDNAPRFKELSYFLAISVSNHLSKMALRERVKELTCLYDFMEISYNPGGSLEEALHKAIKLLPPAFQYPSITSARLILGEDVYVTPGFDEKYDVISSDVYINDSKRGELSVCYAEKKPEFYEGPFLKEERNLIDSFAEEISMLIERKLAEKEKESIQGQLRHADRLATIGQLAAGIAHELNEPLSAILGFSQLLKKNPGDSEGVMEDVSKIEQASLHAREVIKKLLVFSSQAPMKKGPVNLNKLIREGLYVIKARCEKSDIEFGMDLQEDLPEIIADASQMTQVLINLGVNAIQAMPEGGRLRIETSGNDKRVKLLVEDTGTGMTRKVREKAFMPFFTTKDIREGTGLGLSVVHGIVNSHNGSIDLTSNLGRGTKFAISFPVSNRDSGNMEKGACDEKD